MYSATYSKSKALIIGIDEYDHASPLAYAVSDAVAVADLLIDQLGFLADDVTVLTNAEATRSAIYRSFLSHAGNNTELNDRLIMFFAGHGYTTPSFRGEIGYLVPCDGATDDLSTLLRWDELTRSADLIAAKHILFIMDACYGGLAVTRSFRPGAMRFLRDMMRRTSRQVLTAGKADELVSDLGGPLPNHSVFTGHLLQALGGKARDNDGNLTANGVISYVYQAVRSDHTSRQTPHFGYLYGDGDMIFHPIPLADSSETDEAEGDHLVSVPALNISEDERMDQQKELKELLSEHKYRIRLHDFMAQRTRELISLTGQDYFAVNGAVDNNIFLDKMHRYESALNDILPDVMLLGRWGGEEHVEALCMPLRRLADRITPSGGMTYLLESRWYPICLLLYSSGVGATAGGNYTAIAKLFYTNLPNAYGTEHAGHLLYATMKSMAAIHDGFKLFPGHEQRRTPRSDYIFKLLQPTADDTLFLGSDYEGVFDRWEAILALEYMHIDHPGPISDEEFVWAPVGRFGWKHGRPLAGLINEAKAAGEAWQPLMCGLFGRSHSRFLELAAALSRTVARFG